MMKTEIDNDIYSGLKYIQEDQDKYYKLLCILHDYMIWLLETKASEAPVSGLNTPLTNHCLALDILVPFLEILICAVIKRMCPRKKEALP